MSRSTPWAGGSHVVVLRNRLRTNEGDGGDDNGARLAEAVEHTFGLDILEGRGPDNKCSMTLQDSESRWDRGNWDWCGAFLDGFCKVLPQLLDKGCNASDCKKTAQYLAPRLAAAVAAANKHAREAGLERYFPEVPPRSPARGAGPSTACADTGARRAGSRSCGTSRGAARSRRRRWAWRATRCTCTSTRTRRRRR
mmetsp:Transcript_19512/g.47869  ORF Transcript_19512/g.47869 Transcript_19512/m.47869 type:complete len:196 (+) Transcript_19512:249-836(+)